MHRQKPHLIRARVAQPDGTTKLQTVNIADVRLPAHPFHERLEDQQRARAVSAYHRVGKLSSVADLAGWIDRLRYEPNPDRELSVWEAIADAFESLKPATLAPAHRRTFARALLLISVNTVDVESQTGLSAATVSRIKAAWDAATENR